MTGGKYKNIWDTIITPNTSKASVLIHLTEAPTRKSLLRIWNQMKKGGSKA